MACEDGAGATKCTGGGEVMKRSKLIAVVLLTIRLLLNLGLLTAEPADAANTDSPARVGPAQEEGR